MGFDKSIKYGDVNRMNDDIISRQGAINAIENTDCELLPCEWDELTNAIMQWPSARQWIPVTERLPDNSKGVLVTRKTIIGNHRVIDVAYYYEVMNTWVTGDLYTITVDAWMPLPEAWEETKERKEHCE
jgi:hypothetical protein